MLKFSLLLDQPFSGGDWLNLTTLRWTPAANDGENTFLSYYINTRVNGI